MKINWEVVILSLLVVIFLGLIAILFVNDNEDKSEVCKKIGLKTGLEYYNWDNGGECSFKNCYRCKFLDSRGGVIIKKVE